MHLFQWVGFFFLASAVLLAQDENRIENPSFEQGVEDWWKVRTEPGQGSPIEPEIEERDCQGETGARSMRLKCGPGKTIVLGYTRPVSLLAGQKEYSLAFWARSDFGGKEKQGQLALVLKFSPGDRTQKEYVFSVSAPPDRLRKEWTYFQKDFAVPEENGRPELSFRLENPGTQSGTVWIDNVYFGPTLYLPVKGEPKGVRIQNCVHAASHGGVYYPGEPIEYRFELKGLEKPGEKAVVKWQIDDFDGKQLLAGNMEVVLNEDVRLSLSPPVDYRGYFTVKASFLQNGKPLVSGMYSGFIVEKQQGERDPFFSTKGCSSREKHVRMGFGTRTGWLFFRAVERTPGNYDFSSSDRQIEQLLKEGYTNFYANITLSCIRGNQPKFMRDELEAKLAAGKNPYDGDYYAKWRAFAAALIRRYGDRIREWSVPDENGLLRHKNPFLIEHYVNCVKLFREELKKQCPDAKFYAGGETLGLHDWYRTEIWEKIKDHVDGICSDAYLQPTTVGTGFQSMGPEQGKVRERFMKQLELMGPGKEYVNEETGYNIQRDLPLDSPNLRELAIINARNLIVAKSVPSIRRWTWFLVEENRHAWIHIFDFTMWKNNQPRPHAATYAVVMRALANAVAPVEVKPLADVYGYVFKRGDKTVAALWALSKKDIPSTIDMPSDWTAMDLMGKRFGGKKGVRTFSLNDRPVFFEFTAPQENVVRALAGGKYAMPEIYLSMNRKNAEEMNVFLQNKTNRELSFSASLDSSPAKKGKLKPLERGVVSFPCRPGFHPITAKVKMNGQKLETSMNEVLYPVERLENAPPLDGTLRGFEKVRPLVFDTAETLKPIDAEPHGLWKDKNDLSARVYLAYDDRFFYIAADVTDDVHISRHNGQMIWNQDCIQYAFDTENDAFDPAVSSPGYKKDDREFCLALTPEGAANFCYTGTPETAGKPVAEKTSVVIAPDGHKIYSARIPWSYFGNLRPRPGSIFGFNVTIFDVDSREGSTSYYMELSPGIANGKNPSYFKRFLLK